jgi:hypothetical protein
VRMMMCVFLFLYFRRFPIQAFYKAFPGGEEIRSEVRPRHSAISFARGL